MDDLLVALKAPRTALRHDRRQVLLPLKIGATLQEPRNQVIQTYYILHFIGYRRNRSSKAVERPGLWLFSINGNRDWSFPQKRLPVQTNVIDIICIQYIRQGYNTFQLVNSRHKVHFCVHLVRPRSGKRNRAEFSFSVKSSARGG